MSELEDLTAEATGETVGEAKWAALRELERRHPGLDKAAVQFEVVAEGRARHPRRRLRAGARRCASAGEAADAAAAAATAVDEAGQAGEARRSSHGSSATLGVDAEVVARDDPEAIVVTCSGPDVGLLIGRHGQTIDAIQYLLNVIAYRAHGDEKKDVVVDAAGYRARRQATLETLARARRRPGARVRRARGARADDRGRAQGRPLAPQGRRGRGHDLRGHGAEPLRRRRSRLTTGSRRSSRRRA